MKGSGLLGLRFGGFVGPTQTLAAVGQVQAHGGAGGIASTSRRVTMLAGSIRKPPGFGVPRTEAPIP